jgi:uncharacterized membrane protein YhdT
MIPKLIIKVQKNDGCPDCNNIHINNYYVGAVYGTIKMGTDDFDKRFKIASVYNNNVFVSMLWNVTEIIYLPVKVKTP